MQGWEVPQEVGEPERWELTRISGSGLPVSKGWQLGANGFARCSSNSNSEGGGGNVSENVVSGDKYHADEVSR
jgi:hypothetical protein